MTIVLGAIGTVAVLVATYFGQAARAGRDAVAAARDAQDKARQSTLEERRDAHRRAIAGIGRP